MQLPHPRDVFMHIRAIGRMYRDLKYLEHRHNYAAVSGMTFLALLRNVTQLVALHDLGVVPSSIASIWPAEVPMDYRRLRQVGGPEFWHDFNVAMRNCIDNFRSVTAVVRRRV